jgi:hypothetical protein
LSETESVIIKTSTNARGALREGQEQDATERALAVARGLAVFHLDRASLIFKRERREEERRRRGAWLTVSRLVQAAAQARVHGIVVVREDWVRCLVAHSARLAVVRRVPQ